MKRLDRAKEAIRYLATSIAVLSGIWLDKNIENKLDSTLKYVLLGCGVIVLFICVEKLLELVLSSNQRLRKVIMGKENIEGWWTDIIYDRQNKYLLFGGILRVDYEEGELVLSGESFNISGRHVGSFSTTQTTYDKYTLSYRYEIQATSGPTPHEDGIGTNCYITQVATQRD